MPKQLIGRMNDGKDFRGIRKKSFVNGRPIRCSDYGCEFYRDLRSFAVCIANFQYAGVGEVFRGLLFQNLLREFPALDFCPGPIVRHSRRCASRSQQNRDKCEDGESLYHLIHA
ncbi:MAG TPA: hypothetical protein VJT54_13200 [Verrucomicrobiae bacterium]|nr:hypothetical protein [Verrucomicrobiae bacterium]